MAFIISYVYWQYPGRCCSLSFLLIYFLSFNLSRFSFYINNCYLENFVFVYLLYLYFFIILFQSSSLESASPNAKKLKLDIAKLEGNVLIMRKFWVMFFKYMESVCNSAHHVLEFSGRACNSLLNSLSNKDCCSSGISINLDLSQCNWIKWRWKSKKNF